jgi:large subunit ribosomal protein L30
MNIKLNSNKANNNVVINENVAKIKVIRIRSIIGSSRSQRRIIVGLGLNRLMKSKVLENTPSIRGMVKKVKHLLSVERV